MKIRLICLLLFTAISYSYGQDIHPFRPQRYDDDYSYLASDTSHSWYKNTKYQPLSADGKVYLSLGGDFRFQYFNVKNEGWGEEPKDHDGYLFGRYLFHADLHLGRHFRAFGQLQSSTADGKINTSPVDQNPLDLHQAFIDYTTAAGKKGKLTFRAGRQELAYGTQRLVSVREGPNNRQSFDGLKMMYVSGDYKFDLFYSRYVAASKGIFDDNINKNLKFWGAYLVKNKVPVLKNVDLYYFGIWRNNFAFDNVKGDELRHSVGTRIWGGRGTWEYDAEGVYQFGTIGDDDISAWTASLNTTYTFDKIKFHPQPGLKTEFISGDSKMGDGRTNTFDPMFPKGAYFGLASLIGPVNLFDVHPSITLELSKRFEWMADCDFFWRYSSNDGLYAVNSSLIYSGKGISDKYIGAQYATDLAYTPNQYLYFRAEFTWFKDGPFLKQAGAGKDIFFTGITTQIKF
ncbi:alginate export family protein [Chitinophagaceae bacterium MMS25-I14]